MTFLVTAIFLLLSTFATGQSLQKPRISLGQALVHPLEEVSLPVQLSGLEGEDIFHFRLTIQFSAVPLKFVRVEIDDSESTLYIDTNLESDRQDSDTQLESEIQDPDTQKEEKTATLLLQADFSEPLSAGELLELIFEATDEIFESEELVIKIVEASLTTADGEQVPELELEDGTVMISVPFFACLFYMH